MKISTAPIFTNTGSTRSATIASAQHEPIWSAPKRTNGQMTSDEAAARMRAPERLPQEFETLLIATISHPIAPGENHRIGNDRREREIAELFHQLTPLEACDLGRRLDAPRRDDELVRAFARLLPERQVRLRALLASQRFRARLGR